LDFVSTSSWFKDMAIICSLSLVYVELNYFDDKLVLLPDIQKLHVNALKWQDAFIQADTAV
jgi:hypothetical protein